MTFFENEKQTLARALRLLSTVSEYASHVKTYQHLSTWFANFDYRLTSVDEAVATLIA